MKIPDSNRDNMSERAARVANVMTGQKVPHTLPRCVLLEPIER